MGLWFHAVSNACDFLVLFQTMSKLTDALIFLTWSSETASIRIITILIF